MSFATVLFIAVYSLIGLIAIVSFAHDLARRLKAGPTRFRLPLASTAQSPQTGAASVIMLIVAAIAFIPGAISSKDPSFVAAFILLTWAAVINFQAVYPRRDAAGWLVLASGLFSLAVGAMFLALASGLIRRDDRPGTGLPVGFSWFCSVFGFAYGAMAIREYLSGTRVREGGLEFMWRTVPWSRIVVKDWRERDGGFALRLSILSPRLRDVPFGGDREIIVPVPASERPALEAFLATHAARSRAGAEECAFPEEILDR